MKKNVEQHLFIDTKLKETMFRLLLLGGGVWRAYPGAKILVIRSLEKILNTPLHTSIWYFLSCCSFETWKTFHGHGV